MTRKLNLEKTVSFAASHDLYTPYDRYQRLLVLSGTQAQAKFLGINIGSGNGARLTFQGTTYTMLVDGVQVATTDVPAGASTGVFKADVSRIPQGWHLFEIGGVTGGEVCQPLWGFVQHDAVVGEQPFTPVVRGQYERSLSTTSDLEVWVKAPGRYNPKPKPITVKRGYVPPSPTLKRSELHCEHLIPVRFGDMHRPNTNSKGLLSSFDYQAYFWSSLHAEKPIIACLDGPRGVGTACMITHLALSTAAPDGVPRHTTYFSDPWRIGKVLEDGTIVTLVGYRHKSSTIPHWEDRDFSQLELVGDWSSIPPARRGFWEVWGFAWDERTLPINTSAPRIPSENNEQPHLVGPTMFVADTQRNRICKVEFSATAHGVPPKVTEFITGLADPWDLVYDNGFLYVSERKSHRICLYNATTGAFVRVVVQGEFPQAGTFSCTAGSDRILITPTPAANTAINFTAAKDGTLPAGIDPLATYIVLPGGNGSGVQLSTWPGSYPPVKPTQNGVGTALQPLAYVDGNREVKLKASTATLVASPCVLPEGLFVQDGWLYFASKAQAQVRRVKLDGSTGVQVVRPIRIDGNSQFAKLSLSDGTFGPRGSTFTWTWSNADFGGPEMYDNNGTKIQPWWNLQNGGTGDWTTHSGYATAGAIGQGRMVTANMLEGLYRITKSQAGDLPETAAVTAGRNEYKAKFLHLLHGPDGFGFYGLPLPWSVSANIDAYLQWKGHVRP